MAKKYYWMKLFDNFFIDPKIKKLKRLAGGDTYIVITLKIMLQTIKNDGIYEFENLENTLAEELELKIDEDCKNIQVVLDYLHSVQLLIQIDSNNYQLPQVLKMIGSESSSAERVRKHREKKKMLHCNTKETNSNAEIEIEIDENVTRELQLSNNIAKYSFTDALKSIAES